MPVLILYSIAGELKTQNNWVNMTWPPIWWCYQDGRLHACFRCGRGTI